MDKIAFVIENILTCDEPSPYTGRTYPREEVEKAIAKYQEQIDEGRAFGSLNTPPAAAFDQLGSVPIVDISHKVTSIKIDDSGNVIAGIDILDTPAGNIAKDLIETGTMRLSPCMSGVLNEDHRTTDLQFLTTNWIPKSS